MSVEFVLGRPGGAAAAYVDRRIADIEHEDPIAPILVLAPAQSTFGIEEEILQADRMGAHLGLQVTTPQRLAGEILQQAYGGADETIDAAGKSMLIRRILAEKGDELRLLRDATAQLPSLIGEQLDRIRSMEISPEELAGYADRTGNDRFRDLAVIYQALEEALEGRSDAQKRMDMAIAHMAEADFLRGARLVVVRGFSTFTSQLVRFLEELMAVAPEVVFLFPWADEGEPDARLYDGAREGVERLTARALQQGLSVQKPVPLADGMAQRYGTEATGASDADDVRSLAAPADILYASQRLFSHGAPRMREGSSSMTVGAARDIEQEVRAVAAQIAALHQEKGVPFSRMAVVWGDTAEYEPILHRVFLEANIPHFTGEQKTLAQSNLAEFILTATELVGGTLRKDALLAHVATGFTRLTPFEQSVLLNYAFSCVNNGRQFERSFPRRYAMNDGGHFKDDPDLADAARKKLMDPVLSRLRAGGLEGPRLAASRIYGAVRSYVEAVLSEDEITRVAASLGESYEQASFLEQTYKNSLAILEEAEDILGDTLLTGQEARRLLQAGFEAVSLSLVPAGADEVQAGSLGRIHVPYVEDLFVVGVNDEVLPRYATVSKDILTPKEWTSLVRDLKGVELPTSTDEQKYAIVQAMRQARRKIRWSYRTDGENTPSVLIEHLDRLFPNGVDRIPSMEDVAARLAQNAYDEAVRHVRDVADGRPAPPRDLVSGIFGQEEFAQRTERLEASLTEDPQAVPAPLARAVGSLSASSLRTFYECPYKHFLQNQLGLWVPKGPELDTSAAGTYIHAALSNLTRQMLAARAENPDMRSWTDMGGDEYHAIVEEVMRRTSEENWLTRADPRSDAATQVLNSQFRRLSGAVRDQYATDRPQPLTPESRFDIRQLGMVGFLDRLDMRQMPDGSIYYTIVDYKSYPKGFSLLDLLAGTDLQLLLYVLGLQEMIRQGRLPAGQLAAAGFLNVLPTAVEGTPKWWKEYRAKGIVTVPAETAVELYGSTKDRESHLNTVAMRFKSDKGVLSYNSVDAKGRLFLPATEDGGGELDAMLACATDLSQGARRRIEEGDNAIRPFQRPGKNGRLACEFCEFQSICRFERGCGLESRRLLGPDGRPCASSSAESMRQVLMDRYGQQQ